MKKLTAVSLSGGVDSLVAAYLLKNEGHDLIGLHFTTGYGTDQTTININRIAKQLYIPIKIIDCAAEFKSKVVDYFTKTYLSGKTPNPCMVCNRLIKFGLILSCARKMGASILATGHYARTSKDPQGRFHLIKGVDKIKDQSYFLARLTQEQLSAAIFPLGKFTKSEVKDIAKKQGLKAITQNESQDICFIKGKTYGQFLTAQSGYEPTPGLIEDVSGNTIGEHNGLHFFTIGQRRGINCPASEPYYVVGIDPGQNRLIVGFKEELLSPGLKAVKINWIIHPPDNKISVSTRIRGRQDPEPSKLYPIDNETALIRFEKPQSAVTPGQGAVFYKGSKVLGSGWID
ncbi:MAG: tRNA 2-thiouridine(34) synthase MnmA [Deltaproteobacteria bacterium]|nr:tRNA 2-thiouridine(34) synthase MnmA [Deltaproteobacteria bacterium]